MQKDLKKSGAEEWRPVKGYEGLYEVSSLGRVKSLDREVNTCHGAKRMQKSRVLKSCIGTTGYPSVSLWKNGRGKTLKVHILMGISFLDYISDGKNTTVIDHIDNIKTNNTLNNLQILTNRQNSTKKVRGVSKFVGVCWDKKSNKWRSSIKMNGKLKYLGLFEKELDAADAYKKALKYV